MLKSSITMVVCATIKGLPNRLADTTWQSCQKACLPATCRCNCERKSVANNSKVQTELESFLEENINQQMCAVGNNTASTGKLWAILRHNCQTQRLQEHKGSSTVGAKSLKSNIAIQQKMVRGLRKQQSTACHQTTGLWVVLRHNCQRTADSLDLFLKAVLHLDHHGVLQLSVGPKE